MYTLFLFIFFFLNKLFVLYILIKVYIDIDEYILIYNYFKNTKNSIIIFFLPKFKTDLIYSKIEISSKCNDIVNFIVINHFEVLLI